MNNDGQTQNKAGAAAHELACLFQVLSFELQMVITTLVCLQLKVQQVQRLPMARWLPGLGKLVLGGKYCSISEVGHWWIDWLQRHPDLMLKMVQTASSLTPGQWSKYCKNAGIEQRSLSWLQEVCLDSVDDLPFIRRDGHILIPAASGILEGMPGRDDFLLSEVDAAGNEPPAKLLFSNSLQRGAAEQLSLALYAAEHLALSPEQLAGLGDAEVCIDQGTIRIHTSVYQVPQSGLAFLRWAVQTNKLPMISLTVRLFDIDSLGQFNLFKAPPLPKNEFQETKYASEPDLKTSSMDDKAVVEGAQQTVSPQPDKPTEMDKQVSSQTEPPASDESIRWFIAPANGSSILIVLCGSSSVTELTVKIVHDQMAKTSTEGAAHDYPQVPNGQAHLLSRR